MTLIRRNFIKTTGAGMIAAVTPLFSATSVSTHLPDNRIPFRLAIAGYTFARFNFDQSLAMMKRVKILLHFISF